ncbi:MAG: hypothetical protein ACOZCO_10590 [Bacteroidota bacterium]
MTTNLALEYIPRRMRELGYGNNYLIRFRHFILPPEGTLTVNAYSEYFILVETIDGVKVESDTGVFYSFEEQADELQYDHTGEITMTNTTTLYQPVKFIQVIPKTQTHKCSSTENCK